MTAARLDMRLYMLPIGVGVSVAKELSSKSVTCNGRLNLRGPSSRYPLVLDFLSELFQDLLS